MTTQTPDRIEKKILLRATRSRVWQALIDPAQFGYWFGVDWEGPFIPGKLARGRMSGTKVDDDVAAKQKPYEGKPFEITVERMDPERLFSFRWHPYAMDPNVDYSSEPTTLIEFTLDDAPEGILLTVTESGFSKIPLERRAEAFTANDGGWALVITLVEKFLAKKP